MDEVVLSKWKPMYIYTHDLNSWIWSHMPILVVVKVCRPDDECLSQWLNANCETCLATCVAHITKFDWYLHELHPHASKPCRCLSSLSNLLRVSNALPNTILLKMKGLNTYLFLKHQRISIPSGDPDEDTKWFHGDFPFGERGRDSREP